MADLVLNFTNTYEAECYEGFKVLDCTNISGTDMYCDDDARDHLSKLIEPYGPEGIHLIDSGNYHYMTRLFTQMIDEPYELIYFDNHTDMKSAMFDMLSCGAWAKETLNQDKNLAKIMAIGPRFDTESLGLDAHAQGRKTSDAPNITEFDGSPIYSNNSPISSTTLPLYISIDKDVLSTEEVITNWDQGEMTLSELIEILKNITTGRRIIGVDICGLLPQSQAPAGTDISKAAAMGLSSDLRIIEAIKEI